MSWYVSEGWEEMGRGRAAKRVVWSLVVDALDGSAEAEDGAENDEEGGGGGAGEAADGEGYPPRTLKTSKLSTPSTLPKLQ